MTTQDSPLTPNSSRSACCGGHARPDTSRRTVLGRSAAVAAAGAGALALTGCTDRLREKDTAQDHYTGSDAVDALPAAELPVGASREVQVQGRTLMMHRVDETTVTAFTNVCTHQGCLLQVVDRQEGPAYACPCHGSHFDVTSGKPFGGPARQALMDYDAAVVDDRIVVKL
ncbi:Rieske (2Fe-2S) protein [Micrococcus luteus]|nr:Rieske (2Fe-2S) protein [Micrococcus luteus]EZP45623.1 Rieske [2Fe-2S] domain protein [Micrococcus luteus]MCM3552091.1 Rieske (2Fe-2S) protein [Micrococcus luteus]MCV7528660.1 Rieske (2Fe-2S) protein [Micrococcus luteus]MCV7538058.1 Rieske (2Fe-2S) protein [Micrococcus luteus]PAL18983.1 ferredoxin [Micrococcus luteus]